MNKRALHTAPYVIAALFLGIALSAHFVALAETPGLLVIRFIAGQGATLIGPSARVAGLIGGGCAIVAVNLCLTSALYNKHRLLAHAVSMASAGIALLILIAVSAIITVN
jgi:hypothetical protein